MMIDGKNLYLIVAKKSINERKDDTSSTVIDDLIDMRSQEIVLRTSLVQFSKIDTDSNSALLFCYRDNVRYPFRQGYRINKPYLQKLFYFSFDSRTLPRMDLM